jgi:hypothetical protein
VGEGVVSIVTFRETEMSAWGEGGGVVAATQTTEELEKPRAVL